MLLSGARRITHIGASIASTATEKISSGVGRGLAGNPVTKSLADAPEGSMRRRLFDDLTSGAACVGRVIVEADAQGRVLIEEVGRGTSSIAGAKYGTEAENVSKEIAGIALDTYRIVRFPHKLGASSLLKGAFKARFANGDGGSADNMNGMNTHAGMQEVGTDNNAVAGEGIANMNGMNMHAGGQEVGTGNDVAGAGVAAVPYAPYASPYSPQHTSLGPNGFVSRKEDGGRKI